MYLEPFSYGMTYNKTKQQQKQKITERGSLSKKKTKKINLKIS